MSRTMQLIWAVGIVVILGVGYWLWSSSQPKSPALSDDGTPVAVDTVDDASSTGPANSGVAANVGATVGVSAAPMSATVTYDGTSFTPSSVAVAKGGTVTFTSTAGNIWVASAPHPAHTGYDGTDRATHCAPGYAGPKPFDECSPGTSFSFTFTKTGTWAYHDHLNASAHGSVTVQ